MSYKVPVVVSDIPANLEVELPKDSYFPCGNVEALAKKLQDVIAQPLHHIDYGMGKYNWDKIANQVNAIYQSL